MFILSQSLVDKITNDNKIGEIETEMIEAIKMTEEEIEITIEGTTEIESLRKVSLRRSGSPIPARK